jgi:hypothetical protein
MDGIRSRGKVPGTFRTHHVKHPPSWLMSRPSNGWSQGSGLEGGFRDDSALTHLEHALEGDLPLLVPAVVELALEPRDPLRRHVVRRVRRPCKAATTVTINITILIMSGSSGRIITMVTVITIIVIISSSTTITTTSALSSPSSSSSSSSSSSPPTRSVVDKERLVGCDGGVLLDKGDGAVGQVLVQPYCQVLSVWRLLIPSS